MIAVHINLNPYRKAAVAVLGALAQLLVVLDEALSVGVLPEAWVPWVRVALALGTALGVYGVRNSRGPGQHVAGELQRDP